MTEPVAQGRGDWWDCHFHFFDNARYPLAPHATYVPHDAALGDFKALCASRGIGRAVLVQPSVYGANHASFEDALRSDGDWLRGVAVTYPDERVTSDAQLERWHRLGTRGTRINRLFPEAPADAETIVRRVKPLGWHVQLLIDLVDDIDLVKRIAATGVPVVVDHLGNHDPDALVRSTAFADLLALMREGKVWVKLSGAYRLQRTQGPWPSVGVVLDPLFKANDRRLVWGSDWPHPPNPSRPFPQPDVARVGETIRTWLTDATLLTRVMHENPEALYGAEGS
jgi:2-pyrone-4,6-dicarboxylate lactonase